MYHDINLIIEFPETFVSISISRILVTEEYLLNYQTKADKNDRTKNSFNSS